MRAALGEGGIAVGPGANWLSPRWMGFNRRLCHRVSPLPSQMRLSQSSRRRRVINVVPTGARAGQCLG